MLSLVLSALLLALLITILELTEVVALVFALSADAGSIRHGALGAVAGVAVVGVIALGFGAAIVAFPHMYLLWASALVLAAFGVFLYRSTLRSYRRFAAQRAGAGPSPTGHRAVQFAGGFTVGAIETTEVVVVLIALAAAGDGFSALVGAVIGGLALVAATALVHERIRRIKVPWLKLGATSALFSFAVFWAGEAAGVAWPGSDLILIPFAVLFAVIVRSSIALTMRADARST
jgi:Ca2+/H+ antiporter, TMEM165/GDT1 family